MKTTTKIGTGLVGLLIVGVVFATSVPSPTQLNARRISDELVQLPLGTDKAQVEARLKKEVVEHSYLSGEEELAGTSEVAQSGFKPTELGGYIVAIVRNTSGGFIVSGDTQYYFFFDNRGKLLKVTAEDVFTGP